MSTLPLYDIKKEGRMVSTVPIIKNTFKQCKRWFNDKTGCVSLLSYAIEEMVLGYLPVLHTLAWMFHKREISSEVVVSYPRCYKFIRTVMEKLSSLSYTKLDGITECDEFYIKAGLKGRSYHNEIVKAGRKPRKRGLKPWRGRQRYI
jgi:hypothetical protein